MRKPPNGSSAALAGLRITVVPHGLIPAGPAEIPSGRGLPNLGTVEFALLDNERVKRGPAAEPADAILASDIGMT